MSKKTSINLGDHFNSFVDSQVTNGRYGSVSEVIRAALRLLENQEIKLNALRAKLKLSEKQADKREFAEYKLERLLDELNQGK